MKSGARLMWTSFKALCVVFVSFCTAIPALLLSKCLRVFQRFIWWSDVPGRAISMNTGDSFLSQVYCQLRLVACCTCSRGRIAPRNQRLSHLSCLRGSHGYPGKQIRELLMDPSAGIWWAWAHIGRKLVLYACRRCLGEKRVLQCWGSVSSKLMQRHKISLFIAIHLHC